MTSAWLQKRHEVGSNHFDLWAFFNDKIKPS